ncbi:MULTISPECIES: helix-turn-helix transcriptional regulator [Streptomyces]|uniref:helix-turn-helix transcriptional regulator n=1 Tax=Streptomyces TaxID=1883 RepID=UPI0005912688|nr:transcriptional regulator [Streptomyces sp. SCSIO ZS0520]AYN34865.1 transcriptional regulator [Streptomyces albus]
MTRTKVGEALRGLGIGAGAVRVYLALLELAPLPLSGLAERTGLAGEELAAAYAELAEAGLAGAVAGEERAVAPLPPGAALRILTRYRTAEIDACGLAVAGAFESFRRERPAALGDQVVEVVTGQDIWPRSQQAWNSAREQIRQLDSPPYFSFGGGTGDALATLARGVTHRVVYSRASLEYPGNLVDNIEPCIAAGEQARVLPSLPVKLILVDEAYALVSLSIAEAEVDNTLLIVQPCGLFSALVALFEQSWRDALPLRSGGAEPGRPTPADRRLLSLLAAGVGDNGIARELGISRRTLFRRVEVLMARLGAGTRFQLALQAQRRGWL